MASKALTQRRGVHVPRALWVVGLIAIIVALLLVAQNSTVLFPQISSYRLIDERTVALTVGGAPCSWTRVTGVSETTAEVRIKVETLPCPIIAPQTNELNLRELTVTLASDLGGRIVDDAQGQTIPLRQSGP